MFSEISHKPVVGESDSSFQVVVKKSQEVNSVADKRTKSKEFFNADLSTSAAGIIMSSFSSMMAICKV